MKPIADLYIDTKTDIYNLQHKVLHSKQIIAEWQSNKEVVSDQKCLIKEYRKPIWKKRFEILKFKIISIFI